MIWWTSSLGFMLDGITVSSLDLVNPFTAEHLSTEQLSRTSQKIRSLLDIFKLFLLVYN